MIILEIAASDEHNVLTGMRNYSSEVPFFAVWCVENMKLVYK